MPRLTRLSKTKTTNTNNVSKNINDNNNILPPHEDTDTSDDNISSEARVPLPSNTATTSETSTNTNNASSDVPLGVKRYIDTAFEKQTHELKALFQHLNNATLFSLHTVHNLESDSDANSNHTTYRDTDRDQGKATANHVIINEPGHRSDQRTPKRPPPTGSINIDNSNNRNVKKPRMTQGEQSHTNPDSLKEIEKLLQNRKQGDIHNTTFPLSAPDPTFYPVISRSSPPAHQQDTPKPTHHPDGSLPTYFS